MSILTEPENVKLICSIFSPEETTIWECIQQLETVYGPTDWVGPAMFFDRTKYYEREMGWPLHRRIVSFRRLIRPEQIVETKLRANKLEEKYSKEGKRRVNIDPGYISLERLVLATGKNYTHRLYLSAGVYADLTLLFQRRTFRSLEWTFPDYASSEMIKIFNEIRTGYKDQLRKPDGRGTMEEERLTKSK